MRVLLTNYDLALRAGSQLYVRDVACALLARGHSPIVYGRKLGHVADDLRARTVPVVDDLRRITLPPDIIHGQQNHELITALLAFPGVPAVRVCHGWLDQRPQPFPRIRRYVAVDDTTRDRCVSEWALPVDRVLTLLNFADLSRFTPRPTPLPPRPKRALVFSNQADAHLWAVREACARMGVEVEAIGAGVGRSVERPEEELHRYDLVFARGRAAIEALASGAAVIVCDVPGAGPLVTMDNVETLRRLNFGVRTMQQPIGPDHFAAEIARYDARDAEAVSRLIRSTASLDAAVDALVTIYEDAIDEQRRHAPSSSSDEELRVAADYLARIGLSHHRADGIKDAGLELGRALHLRVRGWPIVRSLARSRSLIRWTAAARRHWGIVD
jgi:hypothetical protein